MGETREGEARSGGGLGAVHQNHFRAGGSEESTFGGAEETIHGAFIFREIDSQITLIGIPNPSHRRAIIKMESNQEPMPFYTFQDRSHLSFRYKLINKIGGSGA